MDIFQWNFTGSNVTEIINTNMQLRLVSVSALMRVGPGGQLPRAQITK